MYTLNNGVLSTLDILGHLLVTLLVCLIPYLVASPVPYLFGDYTLFLFRGLAKGGIRRLVWLDLRGRVSGVDGLFLLIWCISVNGI